MLPPAVKHALAQSELFSVCNSDKIIYRLQSFEKGMQLPVSAEEDAAVGLVVRGQVLVYSLGFDGTAVALSTLRAGESFGISNIFTGEDLSTVLVSGTKTVIAYIPKPCFFELLEQTPGMMIRYATVCNRKLRYLTEKIEFLTIPSCRARLAFYLLQNRAENVVTLDSSKEQLAKALGVSRASLFRELRHLSDAGYLTVSKDTITIQEPASLGQLLEHAS